jgi:hypothetical protein
LIAGRLAFPLISGQGRSVLICTAGWDGPKHLMNLFYDGARAPVNRAAWAWPASHARTALPWRLLPQALCVPIAIWRLTQRSRST